MGQPRRLLRSAPCTVGPWPGQEQESKRDSYFQLSRVILATQLPLPQTEKTSDSPSKKCQGEVSHPINQLLASPEAVPFFSESKKYARHHHTSGEMVPDSSLTFFAVRMFSVLMVSRKVRLYLCPWVKLLVHASKQTRAGISWDVRPINRSLFAMTE